MPMWDMLFSNNWTASKTLNFSLLANAFSVSLHTSPLLFGFFFFFLATAGSFLQKIFWLDIISCYQFSTGISLTGSPALGHYFCCLTRESLDYIFYPKLPSVVLRPGCLPCDLFSIQRHLFFWAQEEWFWNCWKLFIVLPGP